MQELINQIVANPGGSVMIIFNLIIIESLLSVDNAAVLATMVLDLPHKQRGRALKYGIVGAYVMRGLAMVFASFLIKFWFLKPLGGLYLLYLVYKFWKGKKAKDESGEEESVNKSENWLYRATVGSIGNFWATVCLIEIMDMAFSIDNIFAAVAFTPNIILVITGVFIGILAMRFIAQWFVNLMEKYAFLEDAAFVVIALLGLKLLFSVYGHYFPNDRLSIMMLSHKADITTTIITISVFFVPILTSSLFNLPKKKHSS